MAGALISQTLGRTSQVHRPQVSHGQAVASSQQMQRHPSARAGVGRLDQPWIAIAGPVMHDSPLQASGRV
jgi:hypothetical protein